MFNILLQRDRDMCYYIVAKPEPKKEGCRQYFTIIRYIENRPYYSFSGFELSEAKTLVDCFTQLSEIGATAGAYAMLEAEAQEYKLLEGAEA